MPAVASAKYTDLTIGVPNGNGLAKLKEGRVPGWFFRTCGHICRALGETSKVASIFIGDAELSPGVPNKAAYEALVPVYQKNERLWGRCCSNLSRYGIRH